MVNFGIANETGRSSGKRTSREKKIWGPPKGEPWTWQTTELQASPAWRQRSINTIRLIDFLQIEHRNHAGLEHVIPLDEFLEKIKYALQARTDPDFLIIGRTDAASAVEGNMEEAIRWGNAL